MRALALVHPGLTTAEAKALLPGRRSARQEPPSRLAIKRLLGRLRGRLGGELPGWSDADWQWLTSALSEMCELASERAGERRSVPGASITRAGRADGKARHAPGAFTRVRSILPERVAPSVMPATDLPPSPELEPVIHV
jgi:hypothetical protein